MSLKIAFTAMAAVILWITSPAAPATAATAIAISECGAPLPENGYLAKDLYCEKGFVVKPPGTSPDPVAVHLDLRGHRLSGSGPQPGSAFVVDGSAAQTSLTVTNGRIDHWTLAVRVSSADFTATYLRADQNQQFLDCQGNCLIADSQLSANDLGVLSHEARLELTGNVISDNDAAIRTAGAANSAYVTKNVFSKNEVGVDITSESYVELTQNNFKQNGVAVTSHVPEEAGEAYFAVLRQNTFVLNGNGALLPAGQGGSNLEKNVAVRNTGHGLYAPGTTDNGGNKAAANGESCVGVICARPSVRESPAFAGGGRRRPTSP